MNPGFGTRRMYLKSHEHMDVRSDQAQADGCEGQARGDGVWSSVVIQYGLRCGGNPVRVYPITALATGFILQFDIADFKCGIDGLCQVPYGQQGNVQAAEGFHLDTGLGINFSNSVDVHGVLVLIEFCMDRYAI